ncbi:putative type IV-A pilus assembly ATPase PilB [Bacteriovorax sp. BSW11_IV]|uniref:GspE/PulE family protein n=1 Tax=Bacteriovorax sp. BSW11_IV TaxID=1353529 RepID=UPI00038A1746|nr:ATPase, T2SS/T4P/T4SS family [Bacteriovorax sp. BSW11_IV]EQC47011.1 putative type IV-A pilus assembly ATPase PilB [Bacteriovorax sp. BSW11_IV]
MFRKEFADVIGKTGMVPLKDLRPLMLNKDATKISELDLLRFDFFDDVKFAKQLSENYKLTFIDLAKAKVQDKYLKLVKKSDIVKYRALPIQKSAKAVTLAIFDPSIVEMKADLITLYQYNIEFILTNISSWANIFERVTESVDELLETVREIKGDNLDEHVEVKEEDIGDDVIRYVNRILADAFIRKASDIHVEPYENTFRVRFRVDGSLAEVIKPPKNLMLPIISRLKIMAQLDISERRKPQDGRIKLSVGGRPIDYRVSSLPTLFGEKVVLRLLDQSNLQLDMTKLGFEAKQLQVFKNGIHQPYGMCLVTGPTGSGKTTTLYSALSELNTVDTNISTAEDPVEFNLEGINQVNVRKEIGLTFAVALKAFLRQDPDVIMVGEIRDLEVGETAVEAALTGHLVLSTLHTNDAPSTVTRLLNMGIEPFLVTGSLNVVVAQRLCRRICTSCKVEDRDTSKDEIISCGVAPSSAEKMKVYKGEGCERCNGSGYKGRVAIYEVMDITPGVKELILKNASSDEIKKQAIKDGMKTLRMSALTKVALGETTLSEAITNSSADKF